MRRMFWSSYIPGTGKFSVSIDNLDKLTNESELCPICLDDFSPENEGLKLEPCGHAIHFGCIRGFFLSSTVNRVTCPLCRGDIMNLVSRTGPSSPKSIDKVSEDKG